jgi:predicted Zn-dependent protease
MNRKLFFTLLLSVMALSVFSQARQPIAYDNFTDFDSNGLKYALQSFSWNKSTISYYVDHSNATQLTQTQRNTAIQQAIMAWENVTPLTFVTAASSSSADILFRWQAINDASVLAITATTYIGTVIQSAVISFDTQDTWTVSTSNYNLFVVALHEFGHALGMAHSDVSNAVMYNSYHYVTGLLADDINGIWAKYGAITGSDLVPCSGNVTYSLIPLTPSATSITWTVPSNIQIVSGQGTSSIVVNKAATGTSQAATISFLASYNGQSVNASRTVAVGAHYVTSLSASSTSAPTGGSISFTAYPASEPGYQWNISPSSGVSQSVYQNTNYITFNQPGSYTVGVRTTSSCTTPGSYTTINVNIGSSYSAIVRGSLIDISPTSAIANQQNVSYTLINQLTGVIAASGQIPATGATLDFSSLSKGFYILRLDTGNNSVETLKVLLK